MNEKIMTYNQGTTWDDILLQKYMSTLLNIVLLSYNLNIWNCNRSNLPPNIKKKIHFSSQYNTWEN